jgi:hypothetical protein
MQSVSQYDTRSPQGPQDYNRDFWAFTPANSNSFYLDRYYARSGLTDDPSFQVKDGLFNLHWLPLENEVWLDSTAGWVAVVDATSQFAMVEHFHYSSTGDYPGNATVIFYKSGSSIRINDAGFPELTAPHTDEPLRYMEAELNSPIVKLDPGQTYAMDTEWNPVRLGQPVLDVSSAGVCAEALQATRKSNGIHLHGKFAVFISGKLEAQTSDATGAKLKNVSLGSVGVDHTVDLDQVISVPKEAAQVSLHMIDAAGKDRGVLGTAKILSGVQNP